MTKILEQNVDTLAASKLMTKLHLEFQTKSDPERFLVALKTIASVYRERPEYKLLRALYNEYDALPYEHRCPIMTDSFKRRLVEIVSY